MGILRKYQSGNVLGFDTESIPDDISSIGKYDNTDISNIDWSIESSEGYKHNTSTSDHSTLSRFRAVSPANNKLFDDAIIFKDPSKESNTSVEHKDSSWRNYKGEGDTASYGESIKLGDTTVTISGGYGMRNLKKYGRDKTEHSRGIDIVTSTGKAHSFKDGVIEDVVLQGSGKPIGVDGTPAAGYYVVVRNNDGSRTQYMHLDYMSETDMKNLKGKKLKRGEEIWGYTTGSGSMTDPHVKVRHYGDNPRYNVDPTQLIRGGNYNFIPDRFGNNILNNRK